MNKAFSTETVRHALARVNTGLLMTVALVSDRISVRTADDRRDRGDVMEKVIIIAGMVALAIALVTWLKPVFTKYLVQIV
ncbi:hypothetical protein [Nocardia terpenica]|uniref:Uncharacterized protein n=1 Tax=Nocardia terpenica TaxID=455432 RepID=A0A6G9ZBT5_9NOCA|nr:hypothetical protein [Nocardia terpenica]QIS22817.1 hypothetical protein F6W96_35255 [Nocardia terpenica]